jgi:hexosaminidase
MNTARGLILAFVAASTLLAGASSGPSSDLPLPVVPYVRSTKITNVKLPPEGYRIRIDADGRRETEFADASGRFYAEVTLRQLPDDIRNLEIEDWPTYSWRGVMVDEGRYFFGKAAIKDVLERMSAFKMNVFHWHLTEDQGWRLDIPGMPELVKYGAVRPSSWKEYTENVSDGKRNGPFFYTPEDVNEIVGFAQRLQIRVIPEIELPGHARSLLAAHPEFSCTGRHPRHPWTETGVTEEVICAGNDEAIGYLERVFDRVVEMFPDEVVHIGGDECPKARWKSCPKCQARMKALGLKNESELQAWLTHHFVDYLKAKGKRVIGWDEILEGGLSEGAMVQSWRMAGWDSASADGKIEKSPVVRAAEEGHDVVSSPLPYTYFSLPASTNETIVYRRRVANYGPGEFIPVEKVYSFNPVEGVPPKLRSRIVGSESCNWTEGTRDYENLKAKMWPRTAALAEVLWTGDSRPGAADFFRRLKEGEYHD